MDSDGWLFELVARDTLPRGKTCRDCANLALLFTTGDQQPSRPSEAVSKNAVQHHERLIKLATCSRTCSLCALLLACFKERRQRALLEGAVRQVGDLESHSGDGTIFSRGQAISIMLEECYGSGKRISELRVTFTITILKYKTAPNVFLGRSTTNFANDVLRVYTEADSVAAPKVQGRPVSKTGGDPRTLQLAQAWIEDCYNNHPECRWSEDDNNPVESDPLLPTRVIDIGESDQDVPRLILPNNRRGKWAALSHRWPKHGNEIIRLLATNVKSMQHAIPRETLAATFQDALTIARVLGLRYLWIDSLCILQDSPADWKEQSHGCLVFTRMLVTIAAAATKDCLGGFLGEREWVPASMPCCLEVLDEEDFATGLVFFDFCIDRNHKKDAVTKTDDVNYLAYRAWFSRVVTKSSSAHVRSASDVLHLPQTWPIRRSSDYTSSSKEYRNEFLCSLRAPLADDPSALGFALRSWYNVLADYSNRNLTFLSDKLVAISGVANVVGSFLGDEYFAGLWRKSLPRGLLWSPYDEEDLPNPGYVATPSSPYRPPSWSWASVDSRISSFLCRAVPSEPALATVLEISTELNGPDPYGQVKSGRVIIRGPFRKFFCGDNLPSWPQQPQLCLGPDCPPDSKDISHCIFDYATPPVGTPLWCLQITLKHGLILYPPPGSMSVGNEFVRIGIFHLRLRDVNNAMVPKRFSDSDVTTIHII